MYDQAVYTATMTEQELVVGANQLQLPVISLAVPYRKLSISC